MKDENKEENSEELREMQDALEKGDLAQLLVDKAMGSLNIDWDSVSREDKIAVAIFGGCEERNPTFHKWVMKITEDYLKSKNKDPMDIWKIITNEFSADFFKDDDSIRDYLENPNKKDDAFAIMTAKGLVMQYLLIECETLANFLNEIEDKNLKTNFEKIELYYSIVELCRKFYSEDQSNE